MKQKFWACTFALLFAIPIHINAEEPCFELAACAYSALNIEFNDIQDKYSPLLDYDGSYAIAAFVWYNNSMDQIGSDFGDCLKRNGW